MRIAAILAFFSSRTEFVELVLWAACSRLVVLATAFSLSLPLADDTWETAVALGGNEAVAAGASTLALTASCYCCKEADEVRILAISSCWSVSGRFCVASFWAMDTGAGASPLNSTLTSYSSSATL